MRFWIVLHFLIMACVSVAYSAPTCAHVFQKVQTLYFDQTYLQKLAKISEQIIEISNETDISLKQSKAQALIAEIQSHMILTQELLASKGVSYTLIDSPIAKMADFGVQWKSFKLEDGNTSPFNKLAGSLEKSLNTSLVLDIYGLQILGANGAYMKEQSAVFIAAESMNEWPLNYVVAHEIMHAKFESARRTKASFKAASPGNMEFWSKESLNPEAYSQGYTKFMSYEELMTHALNIRFIAKAVISNKSIPGIVGNQSFLNSAVSIFVTVSENGLIAANKALELLLKKPEITVSENLGYQIASIKSENGDFSLSLKLNDQRVRSQSEFLALFRQKVESAKKLAEFNLSYFNEASSHAFNPIDPQKALQFRTLQETYIKTLQ